MIDDSSCTRGRVLVWHPMNALLIFVMPPIHIIYNNICIKTQLHNCICCFGGGGWRNIIRNRGRAQPPETDSNKHCLSWFLNMKRGTTVGLRLPALSGALSLIFVFPAIWWWVASHRDMVHRINYIILQGVTICCHFTQNKPPQKIAS